MNKTNTEIKNCLVSDLRNMISEVQAGIYDEELIYSFFSEILLDADVDSRIIVRVLEDESFGKLGQQTALGIKINEGW